MAVSGAFVAVVVAPMPAEADPPAMIAPDSSLIATAGGHGGRPGRPAAGHLFVPEQIDLVPRRDLRRESCVGDRPAAGRLRLSGEVWYVGPFGRIADVEIRVHPGD